MAEQPRLDRRSFLHNAGMTAMWSTVAGRMSPAGAEGQSATSPSTRFDFDEIYNRFGTDSSKYDRQIRLFGKGSIEVGMGIADMDFRAAPVITKALRDRVQHENWGYLDLPSSFGEGIASWNKRRYGVHIDPEQMEISSGVHPALIAAMQTFTPRGGKVLMLTPAYDGFYSDLRYLQVKPEECLMRLADGRYSIDFEDFERHISHDTNTFILCNPHNPTGNVWSPEDLMRLGEICLRRRVIVLADEIHCDFVSRGQRYTPFASLPNKAVVDNSLTFKAASKSFGLSAHKVGWFYSTNPDYIARVRANHRADLNTLGIIANRAAYEGGEDWLTQLVQYIDGTHDFVERYIKANMPLIKWTKAEGTYLAWLDVTGVAEKIGAVAQADAATKAEGRTVTPETIVQRFFVKHAKVLINPGSAYGLGGANHMRMNLATSRKLVERALTNMTSALKNT